MKKTTKDNKQSNFNNDFLYTEFSKNNKEIQNKVANKIQN